MDRKEEKMDAGDQLEMVAKAFVDHYYNLFDTSRAALASLYGHTSMLSFEGEKFIGADDIGRKLTQLPLGQCKHFASTIDCQPSAFAGGIIVFVSGNLQLLGEEHQLKFSQMFQLIPTQQGSFFVQNDIFRLNYG
ncbi:nuclear transport factor 2B-like [Typha latifolia]|uniref:nuclear transport factor 2B-like n=1 Tax=Typha latifolia TaxID=4733 RepID=UPI003C2C1ED3